MLMTNRMMVRPFRAFLVALVLLIACNVSAAAQELSLTVIDASLAKTIDNHSALKISLNEQSKADYAEFTTRYIGRRIEFSFQGHPLMRARLMNSVGSGEIQIVVDQKSIADELAVSLATGRTTVDVRVLRE